MYPDRRCTRHLYLPDRQGMGITTGDYQVPDKSTIQSLLPMVDYTKVEFDKTTGNVTIPSGMTIDLGSMPKDMPVSNLPSIFAITVSNPHS